MTEETNIESSNNECAVGFTLGVALSEARDIQGHPYIVVPEGFKHVSLEPLMTNPMRRTGTTVLRDTTSFINFVNKHKFVETSIYGCYEPPKFTAVFNDHGDDEPGWKDHQAIFDCKKSDEWNTWMGSNAKQMSQVAFAEFIENNLPNIVDPKAADMLEISRTLEAKKKVNFASGIRLSDGRNQLTYEEEISGTAAKGQLQIPEEFSIGIPVLENGVQYAIQCRLRYRINDAKMVMWYEIIRPKQILKDAIDTVWSLIAEKTERIVFNGSI